VSSEKSKKIRKDCNWIVYVDIVNIEEKHKYHKEKYKNTEALLDTSKEAGPEINAEKTKHMFMSCHQNVGQNHNLMTGNKSSGCMVNFKYLRLSNKSKSHLWRIQSILILRISSYHSVQNLLSSHLLSKNFKIKIYKAVILLVFLYECQTSSLTLRKNMDWGY